MTRERLRERQQISSTYSGPPLCVVSSRCSMKGCHRAAMYAEKVSDFWVSWCRFCRLNGGTLDMEKCVQAKVTP